MKRRFVWVRADIKNTVRLHHNIALKHMAFIFTNFLAHKNALVVLHLLYSPDLASSDLFLFPWLKRELKEKYWKSVKNNQKHVTTFLKDNPVE